jgi:hypothetical protein
VNRTRRGLGASRRSPIPMPKRVLAVRAARFLVVGQPLCPAALAPRPSDRRLAPIDFDRMTVEQARQRLLALIEQHGGYVAVAIIEADEQLAANREVASAAAHQLATEPDVTAGEETDNPPHWFPYSFLGREDDAA